jgi:hypothetical protein
MDVFEELTGMYLQRVLGGPPNILRIPNASLKGFYKTSAN